MNFLVHGLRLIVRSLGAIPLRYCSVLFFAVLLGCGDAANDPEDPPKTHDSAEPDDPDDTGTPDDPEDTGHPEKKKPEDPDAIVGVELSPANPTRTDDIHAMITYGKDVDKDQVDVSYSWYLDDDLTSNEEVFAAYTATIGQTVYAVVEAEKIALTSESVEIANSPPEVVSLTLSPDDPYTNNTVSVAVEATDPDEQDVSIVSYEWFVNEISLGLTGASSLSGTAYFDSGDTVAVEVTVSDGTDETSELSETISVLSTAPTAPEVDLGEEETRPGDPLVCEILVEATDIDTTDAATYAFTWYQNVTEYTGSVNTTTLPGDTVPSVATTTGETWTCSVTATIDSEEATAEDWTEIVNLRPDDAPDWWIFSISGHCATCENELNPEYLESNKSSTLDLIHTTMEDYGFTVESFAYSDEFYNRDSSLNNYYANAWLSGHDSDEATGSGLPDRWGFLQVYSDMEYIRDNWQSDFDDPTRVMFVAHSHGDVWAHQAFRTVEDLDIELAIDLDGYSSYWSYQYWWTNYGDDWGDVIDDYNDTYGTSFWNEAYDSWYVDGLGYEDVEDVLPQDNVTYCIEVQASDTWNVDFIWINDDDDNHRPDGTSTGISTYDSSSQDHNEVIEPGGDAMNWVLLQLDDLYGP